MGTLLIQAEGDTIVRKQNIWRRFDCHTEDEIPHMVGKTKRLFCGFASVDFG
jgi:hypothetical protein